MLAYDAAFAYDSAANIYDDSRVAQTGGGAWAVYPSHNRKARVWRCLASVVLRLRLFAAVRKDKSPRVAIRYSLAGFAAYGFKRASEPRQRSYYKSSSLSLRGSAASRFIRPATVAQLRDDELAALLLFLLDK